MLHQVSQPEGNTKFGRNAKEWGQPYRTGIIKLSELWVTGSSFTVLYWRLNVSCMHKRLQRTDTNSWWLYLAFHQNAIKIPLAILLEVHQNRRCLSFGGVCFMSFLFCGLIVWHLVRKQSVFLAKCYETEPHFTDASLTCFFSCYFVLPMNRIFMYFFHLQVWPSGQCDGYRQSQSWSSSNIWGAWQKP